MSSRANSRVGETLLSRPPARQECLAYAPNQAQGRRDSFSGQLEIIKRQQPPFPLLFAWILVAIGTCQCELPILRAHDPSLFWPIRVRGVPEIEADLHLALLRKIQGVPKR